MSGSWDAMLASERGGYVQDMPEVYELGGGSGFVTMYVARCDLCGWQGAAEESGGGGSMTPWNTDAGARAVAQRSADAHNAERHMSPVE